MRVTDQHGRLLHALSSPHADPTFSAFGIETTGLIEGGAYGKAAAYIVMSVSLSILATFGGMAASKAVTA